MSGSGGGVRELFFWYRVRAESVDAARAAVAAMQATLCADVDGLVARLLVRSDDGEAMQTWMETYARPSHRAGVDADIAARIESSARSLAGFIEGDRHGEAFAVITTPDQKARSIST